MTFSIMTLIWQRNVMLKVTNAESLLSPLMLSVIMINVVMQSVIMLSVVLLSVIMLMR